MGLAGIILAAGESTRMGRDKALLPWPPNLPPNTPSGGTLLSAAIKALSDYCDLVIIVAGKNIYPHDIEEIVSSDPRIHDGRAVAFGLFNPDLGTEEIVVVAEVQDEREIENAISIEQAARNAIVAELGVAVRAVYVRPPKWIVKSTAGKAARSTTREKLLREQPELSRAEAL